jgi:hypothetical protein
MIRCWGELGRGVERKRTDEGREAEIMVDDRLGERVLVRIDVTRAGNLPEPESGIVGLAHEPPGRNGDRPFVLHLENRSRVVHTENRWHWNATSRSRVKGQRRDRAAVQEETFILPRERVNRVDVRHEPVCGLRVAVSEDVPDVQRGKRVRALRTAKHLPHLAEDVVGVGVARVVE